MNAKELLEKTPPELRGLVQRGLAHAGYYSGTFGGVPGAATKAALEKFLAGPKTDGADKLIAKLCELAAKEVGTKEVGTNNGTRVNEYQSADDLQGGGYAWCASFQCWLIREAIKAGIKVPFARPTTALAYGFEAWGKNQPGVQVLKTGQVRKGDIIMFREFSHIALAVGDEKDGMIPTIEGNTNGAGSREGDGVYRKSHARSGVRSFVRFQF